MHALHVIAPGTFGGAESVIRALARTRRRTGSRTTVAAIVNAPDHPFVTALEADGVPVVPVVAPGRRYLRQATILAEHIRRIDADIVHTHIYHADVVGYAAARRTGRPVVATYHGASWGRSWRNRAYEWVDRHLLRRFDAVLCVSRRTRELLRRAGCRPDRLHVVPNGMDPVRMVPRDAARTLLGVPPHGLVVGWAGRLAAEKGPDLLLQALAAWQRPDVTTVLVGDGPDRAALEVTVASRGLPRVHFAGALPVAARLFNAFDVLVISSRTEGLPMVMLEAIAAGVPIVSFAVGGIPEVLDDSTAWLAPPNDCDALAAQLGAACGDAAGRLARATRARQRCEGRLDRDAWVRAVDRVYNAVAYADRVARIPVASIRPSP